MAAHDDRPTASQVYRRPPRLHHSRTRHRRRVLRARQRKNHPSATAACPLRQKKTTMITHDPRWSFPRGNTLVPSRWQATMRHPARFQSFWSSLLTSAGTLPGTIHRCFGRMGERPCPAVRVRRRGCWCAVQSCWASRSMLNSSTAVPSQARRLTTRRCAGPGRRTLKVGRRVPAAPRGSAGPS